MHRENDYLILQLKGANDTIIVQNYFLEGNGSPGRIDQIQFANGTVWNASHITRQVSTGTGGDGVLYDSAGDDTLQGRQGNDTYIYSGSIDTIIETGVNDTLVYGNSIDFSQVGNYLTKNGSDLILKLNGSNTDQVIIKVFFENANRIVENNSYKAGVSISAQQIFDAFGLTVPTAKDEGGGTTTPTDPGNSGNATDFTATEGDDSYYYT